MNCEINSFNALRAEMFGYKLSGTDKIVLLRSSPHTHTELRFSPRHSRISFSATMADGDKCARFKQIEYSHPERWDKVIVPMTDEEEDEAYTEAKKLEGTPYDLIGLLSQISKKEIIKPHPVNVWCSEAVNRLVIAGRRDWKAFLESISQPVELTPEQLDMLARYFFENLLTTTSDVFL